MSSLILPHLAFLALLSVAGTEGPGELCQSEMNLIKDLLQVSCSGQGLSTVPSALPKTTGILLLNTNLLASVSTASFQHLPELIELDLSDNRLGTLHTGATLPLLQELILSQNALGLLPTLQGLPNLTRLAMAHNSIAELSPGTFQAVGQLKELNLRGNRLRTLPEQAFEDLARLRDLDLSDNALEELPRGLLAGLQLETLRLSGNQLRSLPDDFFPDGHLFAYVFLAGNPWNCDCGLAYLRGWIADNDFSVYIQEQASNGLVIYNDPHSPVCHAPLSHRGIPVLDFKQACGQTGDVDVNEEWDEDQDIDGITREEGSPVLPTTVSFTTLPPTITMLPTSTLLGLLSLLSVAGPKGPGEPCRSKMNLIKDRLQINCSGQGLSAVPSALPKTTGILLLNTNLLVSVSTASFQQLPELVELDLSDNRLGTLHTGATLPLLQELILSHNALGELPTLQGLPNLTHLAVAHNHIAELLPEAFRTVGQLKELNLRGNQLQTLPQKAFEGLAQLRDLDLSDNALEELPRGLLAGLDLETLWLSGNQLRSLPYDFFPDGHLFAYVFLAGNPWNCDCGLAYLRGWIADNDFSVYVQEQTPHGLPIRNDPCSPMCHAPMNHRGIPVLYFRQACGQTGDVAVNGEWG